MNRISPEWAAYRMLVVPPNASAVQVEECRRAFYAGAVAMWVEIHRGMDPGKMAELRNELDSFCEALTPPTTGKATR